MDDSAQREMAEQLRRQNDLTEEKIRLHKEAALKAEEMRKDMFQSISGREIGSDFLARQREEHDNTLKEMRETSERERHALEEHRELLIAELRAINANLSRIVDCIDKKG